MREVRSPSSDPASDAEADRDLSLDPEVIADLDVESEEADKIHGGVAPSAICLQHDSR